MKIVSTKTQKYKYGNEYHTICYWMLMTRKARRDVAQGSSSDSHDVTGIFLYCVKI